MSAEEKAYQEAMKTVVNKDAKDWTLDEQKAAATDIAKNGTSSVVYAKAKAAMDAGTKFSTKLTNGQTLQYRIVGINHDELASGLGKAGLTFLSVTSVGKYRMNATATNVGGWEQSELRQKMNSGEIWNLMPSELQAKIVTVSKMTDNRIGGETNTLTETIDKQFLVSMTEVFGKQEAAWLTDDGTQYEFYKGKGITTKSYGGAASDENRWGFTRTSFVTDSFRKFSNDSKWNWSYGSAQKEGNIFPAFCF